MSAPLKIWGRVLSIYKNNYQDSTAEFKAGFEEALKVSRLVTEKETQYNLNLRVHELEREVHNKEKTIRELNADLSKLRSKTADKLLISAIPSGKFKYYELQNIIGEEKLTIVTNMDKETFMACWFIFIKREKFKRADECKAKFLTFINHQAGKGFKAYKDYKTARKEGVLI